jgi:hypothetical protein
METGSILIKESVNALQNVRQGVSKCFGAQALELRGLREFIEVYIDNEVYSLSYKYIVNQHNDILCSILSLSTMTFNTMTVYAVYCHSA